MKELTISTVDWRKYLDVNVNPRAKNFLDSRGDDVLWQITSNIHNCIRDDKDELVMMIHENAPYAIKITKSDFEEVKNLTIKWFEKKEQYEKCGEIVSKFNRIPQTKIEKKRTNKNLI